MSEEQYENLPDPIKGILDSWSDDEDSYHECHRINILLSQHGYTCDWDLSGTITEVTPITSKTV